MSINNASLIKSFLSFDKDDFYFLQIIKRRKDNPDMELGSVTLKSYYIHSFKEYDKLIPIVIRQCDFENARAYFRLNKRNYKNLGLKMVNRSLVYIASNNYAPLRNVFDTVAGECPSDPIKKWVIDVDSDVVGTPVKLQHDSMIYMESGAAELVRIRSLAISLQNKTKNEPMAELIPTKNGVHLITRPFNLAEFKLQYPKVDVHKDAVSILYCP